jgi:hypothetical protein
VSNTSEDVVAVLGAPISIVQRERAVFIRPMQCFDCGADFIPARVPAGLPLCLECGDA